MVPVGPIVSFGLILAGIFAPQGGDVFPAHSVGMTLLSYLAYLAGSIMLASFLITRLWRRLL